MGKVKEHDNLDGPVCPKCEQICKNKDGLRNHLLSHYYYLFFEVLPEVSPFTCPECDKEASRDRITLTRHYAFAHNKIFELTDVTPDMLNPSSPKKLKMIVKKEQDEEVIAGVKLKKKEDMKLEVKEEIKEEDIKFKEKDDIKLEVKEKIKLEVKEDVKLKESVAALAVKSDSNFVQWQKSFGKQDAQREKKGKRKEKGETREERRERKEKRRAENKEAERREAKRWEKEQGNIKGSRNEDYAINKLKKSEVVGKPLFSLMMQEMNNSGSWSTKAGTKVKKEESDDEYADLPEPVYACKLDCQCAFHF